MGKIRELNQEGQSIWLDEIQREMITSGKLKKLITDVGITGITSNPSIFEKAIDRGDAYNEEINKQLKGGVSKAKDIYESLAINDIQAAADLLLPIYEKTNCVDGFVSMEVSPYLAANSEETITEARLLWKAIARKNIMIKVPGTLECIPAIRQLLSEGINVNVTLLFSTENYKKVIEAFADGLEAFKTSGGDLTKIASVASFFVSRIDVACDKIISEKLEKETDPGKKRQLSELLGKIGIANSRLAYREYLNFMETDRWNKLEQQGARPQRLLWASTSTKNPKYSDVLYVEELIGENTVNTLPPKTLLAFQDHGKVQSSIVANIAAAEKTIKSFHNFGMSLKKITDQLLTEGVSSFSASFDKLLGALEKRRVTFLGADLNNQSIAVPKVMATTINEIHKDWKKTGKLRRLWSGDSSLWTDKDESQWLGWLTIVEEEVERLPAIVEFATDIKNSEFTDILLLGMGGSSLCSEVMSKTFKSAEGYPKLHILDSTDPEQIQEIENKINLQHTLFIVSSKSGSTLEPNIFCQYFFEKLKKELQGEAQVGGHFIAITDPGSSLEKLASEKGFRKVFHGKPDIGGRYSALSDFGVIPMALMGIDMKEFLKRTTMMVDSCQPSIPVDDNPAAQLGLFLGACGLAGRNKITFFCSKQIKNMGTWLEQLLAESTGKEGKGLIPITGESIADPQFYGNDRVFVHLRVSSDSDEKTERALLKLQEAGHPIVTISMTDCYGMGQEFFRWEMATAIAGAVLEINPFDQPDVEASKDATRELTDDFEKTGKLAVEKPIYEEDGIQVFGNNALPNLSEGSTQLAEVIRTSLSEIKPGDYFGLLAYLPMGPQYESQMQDMRLALRDSKKVATCLEYGPRFLHSTGQVYKGGPNTGVFLEVTGDHEVDLEIPGHRATFGIVEMAQAKGDFQVLTVQKKRKGLRVHLKKDVQKNLAKLSKAFYEALH